MDKLTKDIRMKRCVKGKLQALQNGLGDMEQRG